jgi:hypothetical protein
VRKVPESAKPCPVYQEGWPMDLYEMSDVNRMEYVSKMGLVTDLGEVSCTRKSSASYQLEVVALLLLEMKVKDDRPS